MDIDMWAGWVAQALAAAPDWIAALLTLVGAASAIAALTPTPRDDHVLAAIRRVLDLLALNVGQARRRR